MTLASSVQLTVRYKVPDDPNMSSCRAKVKGAVVFFHDKEKSVFIKPILLHVSLPAHTYCPEVARIQRTGEKIALVAFLQILNNPQQTIILQIYVCVCVCVQLMPYSGDSVVVYTAKIHNHHVFWLMIPVLVYFYCSAVTNFGHNRQSGKTVMKSMKMNKVGNKQKRLPFP